MENVFELSQGLFVIWGVGSAIACSLVIISGLSHYIVRTKGEKKDEQRRKANRVSRRRY